MSRLHTYFARSPASTVVAVGRVIIQTVTRTRSCRGGTNSAVQKSPGWILHNIRFLPAAFGPRHPKDFPAWCRGCALECTHIFALWVSDELRVIAPKDGTVGRLSALLAGNHVGVPIRVHRPLEFTCITRNVRYTHTHTHTHTHHTCMQTCTHTQNRHQNACRQAC